MKRECGWCSKFLGFVEPLEDKRITTGMCEDCLKEYFPEDAEEDCEKKLNDQIDNL